MPIPLPEEMPKFLFSLSLLLLASACCPDLACPELPELPVPTSGASSGEGNTCDEPLKVCAVDADCDAGLKCVITAKGEPEQRRCLTPCELDKPSCPCAGDHCTVVSGAQVCFAKLGG